MTDPLEEHRAKLKAWEALHPAPQVAPPIIFHPEPKEVPLSDDTNASKTVPLALAPSYVAPAYERPVNEPAAAPPQRVAEPALRYDGDKSRVDLIPPEFILALGKHYGAGAKKYADRNWEKGMSWSRCYASAQRHMLAFWSGEEVDEEGAPNVIAAAWNMAALHWYALKNRGTDDRPKFEESGK